jgi:hypothetical protein
VAVDVAIVAAAIVVAAALVPASLLLSFAVLLAAGAAIGLRGASQRGPIVIGCVAGAALVYAWTVVREPPADVSASLRNGLAGAIALALILGAAFVLPGYLFGRASRRSRVTPVLTEGPDLADRGRSAPGAALRSDVGVGVLILVAVTAAILWILRNAPVGP